MKQKLYYWEIHFDNGDIEYWRTKKSTYNFKTILGPNPKYSIIEARPITRFVYWYKRNKYQKSFEVTWE